MHITVPCHGGFSSTCSLSLGNLCKICTGEREQGNRASSTHKLHCQLLSKSHHWTYFHERGELLTPFFGHCVIHGGAHAPHGAMAFQSHLDQTVQKYWLIKSVFSAYPSGTRTKFICNELVCQLCKSMQCHIYFSHQSSLRSLSNERLVQVRICQGEGDVHTGFVRGLSLHITYTHRTHCLKGCSITHSVVNAWHLYLKLPTRKHVGGACSYGVPGSCKSRCYSRSHHTQPCTSQCYASPSPQAHPHSRASQTPDHTVRRGATRTCRESGHIFHIITILVWRDCSWKTLRHIPNIHKWVYRWQAQRQASMRAII